MRTSRKAKEMILSLSLAAVMAASSAPGLAQGLVNVVAWDVNSSVVYNPMTATKDPFKHAPTFTMQPTQTAGDNWEFIQAHFETVTDFNAETDYLAVQLSFTNYCAFTLGVIEGGDRYATMIAGKPVYFLHQNGTLEEKAVSGAADVAFPANEKGMLLVPMSSLAWQWNNEGSDLKGVGSFYMTANSKYIWGYKVKIGSVGVYRGDPSVATTKYDSLLDVTSQEKKNKYYCGSQNPDATFFPSDAGKPEEVAPVLSAYPFRTGDEAFVNGAHWIGPKSNDASGNWQTLHAKFDTATVDMSNAKYLVLEYNAKAGSPGMTIGLNSKGARYDTCIDGNGVWGVAEGQTTATKLCNVLYAAASIGQGFKGALIIPMDNMGWEGWSAAGDKSLATIDKLTITTNSQFNWNYEAILGEIGYITDDGAYVSMLDLAADNSDAKHGNYWITSDNSNNAGVLEYHSAARKMQGDSTIDFTAKNMKAENFDIWTGGSYGQAEMVKDSYGDDAVKLMATGSNPTGDAYTAITLAGAGGWSWAGMTGVSFWAKNESDTEVSFNLEVDCKDNTINKSDRFNIKQGNRFYLYDINTGKTTIYMTRPCATLPVGFEGWVYVPFSAFARADWSNNGVTNFMGENTVVSYLAITIHAGTYLNKAFSVNKFGGYTKVPSFESTYVKSENTISNLLGLNK